MQLRLQYGRGHLHPISIALCTLARHMSLSTFLEYFLPSNGDGGSGVISSVVQSIDRLAALTDSPRAQYIPVSIRQTKKSQSMANL